MPEHKPENSDQSPSEQRPKAERETSIAKRKEQLEKRFILLSRVIQPEPARAFNSWYTRIENPLGASTVTNTPSASRQLMFTLAMCDHPAVDDLLAKIERGDITEENFNPDSLAKAEVERGMKILDLGCGPAPTFARTARRLGANVYTVDVIPASEFRLWRPKEGGADYLKQVEVTSPDEYNKMILLSDEYETTRREEADRISDMNLDERQELFGIIIPHWENAIKILYGDFRTNISILGNESPHLHAHLVPRQINKTIYGVEFKDPNPKGNYAPYEKKEIPLKVLIKIRDDIKKLIS